MNTLNSFKILFYTREGPNDAGYEIRTLEVIKALKNSDYQIQALSFKSLYSVEEIKLHLFLKIICNIKAFIKIFNYAPDCLIMQRVNYHFPAALFYFFIKQPFFILDLDDWEIKEDYLDEHGKSKSFAYSLTKWLCSKASLTVFSSEFLYKKFSSFCRNTVRIPSYTLLPGFKDSSLSFQNKTILWSGAVPAFHLETQKELLNFTESFKKNAKQNLYLVYILRGDLAVHTAQLLMEMNIPRLTVLTHIPRNEMINHYARASFGILPLFTPTCYNLSKSPVKLFEYLACGLIPVVSSLGEGSRILSSLHIKNVAENIEQMIQILNEYSSLDDTRIMAEKKKISDIAQIYFSEEQMKTKWIKAIQTSCRRMTAMEKVLR